MNYIARLIMILFSLNLIFANNLCAQDEKLHIYLAFGQSNMAGQNEFTDADLNYSNRFKVLRAASHSGQTVGELYPGQPPLAHSGAKLGLLDFFGREMVGLMPEDVTIAIANVAIGSIDIDIFNKSTKDAYIAREAGSWWESYLNEYGGDLYDRIIEIGKVAKGKGVIKGILLHQGETNTGQSTWPAKVKNIYDDIITDLELNSDEVPLLIGELGTTEMGGSCGSHNPRVAEAAALIPNAYAISAANCPLLVEQNFTVHFTREGSEMMGKRYAEKMYSLLSLVPSDSGDVDDKVVQGPFNEAVHIIPGIIELSEFDLGGNNIAYFDDTPGNEAEGVSFRSEEDVDIEDCTLGGYNLGYMMSGEWLEYTATVEYAGKYDITIKAAADGDDRSISLFSNNNPIAENINIPNTGGWQTWQDVLVENIDLAAGKQIIKVAVGDVNYVNLKNINFKIEGITETAMIENNSKTVTETMLIKNEVLSYFTSGIAQLDIYGSNGEKLSAKTIRDNGKISFADLGITGNGVFIAVIRKNGQMLEGKRIVLIK